MNKLKEKVQKPAKNALADWDCLLSVSDIQPLPPHMAELYLLVGMMPDTLVPKVLEKIYKTMSYQILQARLHATGFIPYIDPRLLILCAGLCDTLGDCVMWAYTLARLAAKHNRTINLGDWIEAFPLGLPTRKAMNETWDAQKGYARGVQCDNCLDNREYWPTPPKSASTIEGDKQ